MLRFVAVPIKAYLKKSPTSSKNTFYDSGKSSLSAMGYYIVSSRDILNPRLGDLETTCYK
jgi:hypothetical protein